MLKKYLSKFTIDILPSIMATVVGAYIVNVYIIPKTREERPPAPAAQSVPAPDKAAAKPAEAAAAVDVPEPAQARKPVEKAAADKTDAIKTDSAKADAAKAAEQRRHVPAREKAVAKAEPAKAEPPAVAPAPTPVVATVGTAPAGDANDLARAAIERLSRGDKTEAPRMPERTAAVQPQPAQLPALPPVQQAQPMQQLPPPIVVSTPSVENPQPMERADQPRRPRPPGEIPVPLATEANADTGRTNVVEDVLSGAKSMFDKVIPRPFER